MHTFTYVAQLTEDNLEPIIQYGAQHNLNLADFRDDVPFNAEDGFDTCVIASIDWDTKQLRTITTVTEPDIARNWVLHENDKYLYFTRATRR